MVNPATRANLKWGIVWQSKNPVDGVVRHFVRGEDRSLPRIFRTRQQARDYAKRMFSDLAKRDDLRRHGWKMPRVVRVRVVVSEFTE